MLIQLNIKHLATIHELNLDFQSGTTVITGETGAGKSILMDAILLALGGRATQDMVRQGHEKAEISITFDVQHLQDAKHWLQTYELDNESNECIIRRTIHKDGKSRSFINGMPTTLQPLRELSELLIQIHGQHEHQSLLKADYQRQMLDRYAEHTHLVDSVEALAEEWQTLQKNIKELRQQLEKHNARNELLKFQLQELEQLHLTPDEFPNLDLEHKQLSHSSELLEHIKQTLHLIFDGEEFNTFSSLNQALHALEMVKHIDPKIDHWCETIRTIQVQLSDIENDLTRYLDTVDLNPERLQWLEERMSRIFEMARKHKINPQELFEFQQKLRVEQKELETSDAKLAEWVSKLDIVESKYHDTAKRLSQSRKKAAETLADDISKMVRELSLTDAEFQIFFEYDDTLRISTHGFEKIIFYIKTNLGDDLKPLAKIASGGELSRIGLAIHIATANQKSSPCLLFDEIDVGIGGGTAEIVGKLLRRLGQSHQVLCITHQPLVAALGHHHVKVSKVHEENRTQSLIQHLSLEGKIAEIARMLGGVELTKNTLAHARELVEKVN